MKLPRDLSADELIKGLRRIGYEVTRQTGSHVRLTRATSPQHHITIPQHSPLKIGTLNSIVAELSDFLKLSKEELLKKIGIIS
ncbi:MAG TPA: type II toxin-antitoxin system HicA family toxin [Candidatus Ozemobacteraceae bacterium]|nr:type II toxin-antitoxin system HicA family toxin [Candidatus Ozemobacteraceae bacterium]